MEENRKSETVNPQRTMNVIYVDTLRGMSKEDCDVVFKNQFTLYKVIRVGILKVSAGIKKSPSDVFVLDVTGAPDWFMERYSSFITTMPVISIVGELKSEKVEYPGSKITSLLSPIGVYSTLEQTMCEAIGNDYVSLIHTPNGLRLEENPNLRGSVPGDVYIRIDTSVMSDGLLSVISSEIVELVQDKDGLYRIVGEEPSYNKSID